ncbi:MAG: hypothetical protein HQL90_07795 [Magnetococcales bacterium]|nr:hypothetical protein [Magnetococcales bacterium]
MNTHRLWLLATLTLLLGGCSGNMNLPWESNFLDPARVATREPLEIPPDLNRLPPVDGAKAQAKGGNLPWNDTSARKTSGSSGSTIHLPPPTENTDNGSLSRNQQEKLPSWMEVEPGRKPGR